MELADNLSVKEMCIIWSVLYHTQISRHVNLLVDLVHTTTATENFLKLFQFPISIQNYNLFI